MRTVKFCPFCGCDNVSENEDEENVYVCVSCEEEFEVLNPDANEYEEDG